MADIAAPVQDPATLEWSFPASWSEAHREAWNHASGELVNVEKTADAAQAKAAAYMASPDTLIAIKQGDLAEAKRALDFTKRQLEGQVAWLKTRATMGDDVRRIDSVEGDVIILRRMSEGDVEGSYKRAADLANAERARLSQGASEADVLAAQARALVATKGAHVDALLRNATIAGLDEQASTARLRTLMAKYYMLWPEMRRLQDEMIQGFRVAEGKDSAPY